MGASLIGSPRTTEDETNTNGRLGPLLDVAGLGSPISEPP
jgi:hypothetical protein